MTVEKLPPQSWNGQRAHAHHTIVNTTQLHTSHNCEHHTIVNTTAPIYRQTFSAHAFFQATAQLFGNKSNLKRKCCCKFQVLMKQTKLDSSKDYMWLNNGNVT